MAQSGLYSPVSLFDTRDFIFVVIVKDNYE